MIEKENKIIELDELKQIQLKILIDVDNFCKDNDIQYSLCAGTLLGAVRHLGFIPWDDDIDIMMTRDNYEKFLSLYNSKDYDLITYKNKNNFYYLFAKVSDNKTYIMEHHNKKVDNLGVYIDIFPIDFLGESYKEANKKLKKMRFKKYIGVASNWKKFYINNNRSKLRQIPRFIFYYLSKVFNVKKMYDKIEKRITKKASKYMGSIASTYESKEIMPSIMFEEYTSLQFEGYQFMVIKEYSKWLSLVYGNYMELPPEEKRVTHHSFTAFYK